MRVDFDRVGPITSSVQGHPEFVTLFYGNRSRALELSLVLESRGVHHELANQEGPWAVLVPADEAGRAQWELARYADETLRRRELPPLPLPFAGAWLGALGYVATLLCVAFLAGRGALQLDWFGSGSLEHRTLGAAQWWRCLTALTLHVDQMHVMGNLLFGVGFGVLAGRIFGAGVAWLGIVIAAALANLVDISLAPVGFRAIGASTAAFAALGMLTGFAWQTRFAHLGPRERMLRRSSPVIAGLGLLVLLGDGAEHVDVIGHICGFGSGTALGWALSAAAIARTRAAWVQWLCGCGALALIAVAWLCAYDSGARL